MEVGRYIKVTDTLVEVHGKGKEKRKVRGEGRKKKRRRLRGLFYLWDTVLYDP